MTGITPRTRVTAVALAVIVVGGVVLRVRGLAYGLPAVYNPDEIAIMSRALGFAKGDLNPHNFLYPSLYFYALFGWVAASFAVDWALGIFRSVGQFQQSLFVDPTAIYVAGRSLSVACGALAIVATWRLGSRLADDRTGLAAAAFLAVAPFAVRDAHYVKHDVPATLAVLLAMLAIVALGRGAFDDGTHDPGPTSPTDQPLGPTSSEGSGDSMWGRGHASRRRMHPARSLTAALLLAGFASGLAASVHYYLIFVGVPLVIAVWYRTSGSDVFVRLRSVCMALASAAAGFFLGSPFLFVEPATALRDIAANRRIVMDRAVDATGGLFPSASAYLQMLSSDALGWPVALLALVGLIVLARRAWRLTVLLAAFPLTFLLFISNTVAATRYLNPVLPFLCVFAAAGVVWLADRIAASRGSSRLHAVVLVALIVLVAAPAMLASVEVGTFFRQPDTRTVARAFIESHAASGSTVLVQPYSVPLVQSRDGLVEALRQHLGDESKASIKFQLQLSVERWPAPAYRLIYLGTGGLDVDKIYVDPADIAQRGLGVLRDLGVQYVVLKGYNGGSPAAYPLAAALAREARRVAVFTPYRPSAADPPHAVEPFLHNSDARIDAALERPGPVIELWKL